MRKLNLCVEWLLWTEEKETELLPPSINIKNFEPFEENYNQVINIENKFFVKDIDSEGIFKIFTSRSFAKATAIFHYFVWENRDNFPDLLNIRYTLHNVKGLSMPVLFKEILNDFAG